MQNYFIEYDNLKKQFVSNTTFTGTVPNVNAIDWWTSVSIPPHPRPSNVTHFGNRAAAEFRAQVNANFNCVPDKLYCVNFKNTLRILPAVYIENSANDAMHEFESMLLKSGADAALYWNSKEDVSGSWSLIVRQDYIGDLPKTTPNVSILKQFSGKITSKGARIAPGLDFRDFLCQIEWT
ncbi:hypothetical protein [Bifidobacterium psychraerophilum]|uniref:hypothetical protein n=1 Tax=Bifidobacterium psychraerophilum TaxID=218140 RepID=UPI0039E96000